MSNLSTKSKAYAQALFHSTHNFKESPYNLNKDSIFSLGEELVLIGALLVSSTKLRALIQNETVLESQKLEIILSFFPNVSHTMLSFLRVLAEKAELKSINEISDEYQRMLLKFKSIIKVTLSLASPLEEMHGPALLRALKKLTGAKEVILSLTYSPQLIGGLAIQYNCKAIDISGASDVQRLL